MAVADALRPESREAVQSLRRQGLEVIMLTGDNRHAADAIAGQAGCSAPEADHSADKQWPCSDQGMVAGGLFRRHDFLLTVRMGCCYFIRFRGSGTG
ncbi:MAG: HAD family hydrolase [Pirellulaceae bacterium]|nr:HAD family hydrolase [Pirellulaceae bacterium]